jgi:hypothetical protein
MQVKLQRDWFGPEGVRYRSKGRMGALFIRTVPDEFLSKLPSDAEVYDESGKKLGTVEQLRTKAEAPAPLVGLKKE